MPRPDVEEPSTGPRGGASRGENPGGAHAPAGCGAGKPRESRPDGPLDRRSPERTTSRIRHDFAPGRLIAGLTALTLALLYAGDATGTWHIPWFVVFPVLTGGLTLAGAASFARYSVRRRRAAMTASSENTEAPASTSGSQATR